MSAEQKTVLGVALAMRHGVIPPHRHDRELLNFFADQLMEARKHETEVGLGNCAAMREALVAVKKSIDGIGTSSLDCDPAILMASLTQVCARLSARIDAALSAPPRNCDKYATVKDAAVVFARVKNNLPHPTPDFTFSAWLLDVATESEEAR